MTRLMGRVRALAAVFVAMTGPGHAAGTPYYVEHVQSFVETHIYPWLGTGRFVELLAKCNAAHRHISAPQIRELDRQWLAEASQGGGRLIDSVITGPFADALRAFKTNHEGVVTELFITDQKGLLCASSEPTSDFWHGDEEKFTRLLDTSGTRLFIARLEYDESVFVYQSQASLAIADPRTGQRIGVLVIGVNLGAF